MRPVSGKEMCRMLLQNGWVLKRVKGSHYIFGKSGERKLLVVPVHGNQDLKPGLARALSRDSGIVW